MSSLSYAPRSDASTEQETAALASVYRFILDCHAKKQGGPATSRPEDAKGSENDRAEQRISRG